MIPEGVAGARPAARILVVDDNADTAESMARLLSLSGHEVRTARDGPEALATAIAWRPEYILLDLCLPGLSGYQVATRLRQGAACQGTVIIAVTGQGLPEDRQRSRETGIDHHLLKPVDLGALLALLSQSDTIVP
jgi:CheY-like chemotaxis protein